MNGKTLLRAILKELENNEEVMEGLKAIADNKPKERMLIKASEELSELQTAILQIVTKVMHNGKKRVKVRTKAVADEFVDVLVNLVVLADYLGEDLLMASVKKKSKKFLGHKDLKRYGKTDKK